eukprot:15448596-Alexandrium_andersonii.AAC.1
MTRSFRLRHCPRQARLRAPTRAVAHEPVSARLKRKEKAWPVSTCFTGLFHAVRFCGPCQAFAITLLEY